MTEAASGPATGLTRHRWLPLWVLLATLALTTALCGWSLRTNASEARALLERRADSFAQALSNRVQSYIDTLPGLQTFGVLKNTASDAEFAQYVRAISLQKRFPGMAVTFIGEWVPAEQRDSFVAAVRADRSAVAAGHPDFDITPTGKRPGYMVLRHTYPFDYPGFGYDLYDPTQRYRAAVEQALNSGRYTATGPLLLARDRFKTGQPELTSIVIRGGVYAGGLTPATAAARQQAARGVVGVSFGTMAIVRSVLQAELERDATLRIVDRSALASGENGLVFDSVWLAGSSAAATAQAAAQPPLLLTIEVADRTWDISVQPRLPAWPADSTTWWLLALGTALSLSLAVMTHTLVQAEKENLEKSEARYRTLFANSLDAVLRTRPDGAVLAANAAACALFGRSETQLQALGREALADATDPRLAVLLAERAASGRAQGHIRMHKADGGSFEAEVASNIYVDSDGRNVASVIVRDVTVSQRLAERQAMLVAILDNTPDFVGSTDARGRNMYLNRSGRRLLGRGEHENLSALTIAECHPPWAAQLILEEGVPAARRDGVWFGRTAIQAADGRELPVSQVIIGHRNAQGEVTHFSTIARDLTELERVQAERQALQAQLQASQKLESLGTLAGGVAHDFNNVLAAILGSVAIARQDAVAGQPVDASLERIALAATRARALVQQILTFSRRTPQVHAVQLLRPALEEALSLLRATLPASAELVQVLTAEALPVRLDGAQVQQVLLNLGTNAWQALPEQTGRITVRLEAVVFGPQDAAPPGLRPGRHAHLQVQDNGAGMDEATRARVFEPFFTTKQVGQGTGLGLAVVHGIVSACGGAITVASQPGCGARFDVYLPLAAAPAETAAADPVTPGASASQGQGQGQHVLLVDDDEVVALTTEILLQRCGYRVTRLADGVQALALLRTGAHGVDLLVTDHNMPGMSGLALAEALQSVAPGLPVIITSGYVTEALRLRARQAGVRAVLLKEYAVEELGGTVHTILAGAAVPL